MDQILTSFIRALRNADVRISTAETLDAFGAVELVGYRDRQLLKDSLALVLPKTLDEKAAFDVCFDQFFASRSSAPLPSSTSDAVAEDDGTAGEQGGNSQVGGGGDSQSQGSGRGRPRDELDATEQATEQPATISSGALSAPTSELGQLLTRGNSLEINIAIDAAGRQARIQEIEVFTQKGVYSRRILDGMGYAALRDEIISSTSSPSLADRRLAQDLTRRRDWLRERIRDYVEHQFLLHADVKGRRLQESLLKSVRLSSLEQRHHRLLQDLVLRMARKLVSAYSRRRKVFRRGQLHVPRTLRRNMKYDDAIFDLHWKQVKTDQPKVFAICDVSGSVADYARFMLMFLYSLNEVLPKVRAFAFSSSLGEVTDLFQRHSIDDAIALTLREYGAGSTDYGQALADFSSICLADIDRRTTVIILGDARNNYGDSRSDALKSIYERARRVIWLNPEGKGMWNTGDSEMRHYSPYCHQIDECSTVRQLEQVIGRLIASTR